MSLWAHTPARPPENASISLCTGRRPSRCRLFDPTVDMTGEAALRTGMDWVVRRPGPAAELGLLVIGEGLLDLLGRRHHERSVLGDRLPDGPPLQQQQFGLVVPVLQDHVLIG